MPADPALELAREQTYLEHARHELARMREHTLSLESAAGDRIAGEHLAYTLWQRARSLIDDPASTLSFGRIGTAGAHPPCYIGRRHVSDADGEPVVVDWRAEVSTAFYRATRAEPMGVRLRQRFGVDHGALTAYEDEHLLDPEVGDLSDGATSGDARQGPGARPRRGGGTGRDRRSRAGRAHRVAPPVCRAHPCRDVLDGGPRGAAAGGAGNLSGRPRPGSAGCASEAPRA